LAERPIDRIIRLLRGKVPLEEVPRRWKRIGDVLILREMNLPEEKKLMVGKAFSEVLGVNCVLERGRTLGRERNPRHRVIIGNPETVHRENGCLFKLDVSKLTFSPGNFYERSRIPLLVNNGERVLDMFAGVGQFSIPIAKLSSPKEVVSIEINPLAFNYLKENIKMNKVEGIVKAFLGDSSEIVPSLQGKFHRVIMGYLNPERKFIDAISEKVSLGSVIHYHFTAHNREMPRKISEILEEFRGSGLKTEVQYLRSVKTYSPGVKHYALDLEVVGWSRSMREQ